MFCGIERPSPNARLPPELKPDTASRLVSRVMLGLLLVLRCALICCRSES